MSREYVIALKESLEKKIKVLEEIERLCNMQTETLDKEPMDYEGFDAFVNDKDILIERLTKLDEGFETVYARVSDEIKQNKDKYSDLILQMKDLIGKITDLGVSIQTIEEKNRKKVSEVMERDRRKLFDQKRSVSVALNYYKNMSGMGTPSSQFMDKKK